MSEFALLSRNKSDKEDKLSHQSLNITSSIHCTLGRGQQRRGVMPLGLFLFFRSSSSSVFCMVTCPRPPVFARPKKYRLSISVILGRLLSFHQNFHESRCTKLLGMQWHKNPFDESEDEDTTSFERLDVVYIFVGYSARVR